MSETYRHPKLVHSSILLLAAAGVYYAGDYATGGYENAWNAGVQLYNSALGLKHFSLDDSKLAAATSGAGMATSSCLDQQVFSADTVRKVGENPDTFLVYVRKIGAGTLDAAAVEACATERAGFKVSVALEK